MLNDVCERYLDWSSTRFAEKGVILRGSIGLTGITSWLRRHYVRREGIPI